MNLKDTIILSERSQTSEQILADSVCVKLKQVTFHLVNKFETMVHFGGYQLGSGGGYTGINL